jgi:hypothetical protein
MNYSRHGDENLEYRISACSHGFKIERDADNR